MNYTEYLIDLRKNKKYKQLFYHFIFDMFLAGLCILMIFLIEHLS